MSAMALLQGVAVELNLGHDFILLSKMPTYKLTLSYDT